MVVRRHRHRDFNKRELQQEISRGGLCDAALALGTVKRLLSMPRAAGGRGRSRASEAPQRCTGGLQRGGSRGRAGPGGAGEGGAVVPAPQAPGCRFRRSGGVPGHPPRTQATPGPHRQGIPPPPWFAWSEALRSFLFALQWTKVTISHLIISQAGWNRCNLSTLRAVSELIGNVDSRR